MRQVGEKKLNAVPTAKRDRKFLNQIHKLKKREFKTKCSTEGCEYIEVLSERALRFIEQSGREYTCHSCKDKAKKETNQAIINLAKRKGLI